MPSHAAAPARIDPVTTASPSNPPPVRPRSRALRNVLFNWGAFAVGGAVNFALAPFVVRSLGDVSYGAWVLIGSFVGYLGLLDLGIRGAVMRFVAKLHAAHDHEEAGRMASAGLMLFGIAGVLAMTLAVVLALSVERFTTIPPELIGAARVVLVIGGVNIAVALVSGVFGGVITALQRFDLASGTSMVLELVRALVVFLVLRSGAGLVTLALVQLGASVASCLVSAYLSATLYPQLRLRLRSWRRDHMSAILAFSATSTLLHVASMVILQLDSVIIGATLPVQMITVFAIAANLTNYARSLISGVSQTVAPRLSALEGAGATREIATVPIDSARLASLALLPIVVTFLLRGGSFIGLWMGPQYAELSGQVLWTLSIALWFAAGRQVIASALMGLNLHKHLAWTLAVEAVMNVGISLALVRHFGLIGIAWGTALPSLVFSIVVIPWVFARLVRVPLRDVVTGVWLRPTLAILPFAAATFAVDRSWPSESLLAFFGQVALVLPLAAAGGWWIGLTPAERARFAPQPSRGRVWAFFF